MVSCKWHLNLISIGVGSSSKGLGSNLWLLTNKNAPFRWTLDLGPRTLVSSGHKFLLMLPNFVSRSKYKNKT
jgi:hypothetical protein